MISKSLIAASSKPLVLAILKRGESYGYQIIRKVRDVSRGAMEWSDGMLYPVLHRLEKEGLIVSQWKMSEEGRPRRYYNITPEGLTALDTEMSMWQTVHEAVFTAWQLPEQPDNR